MTKINAFSQLSDANYASCLILIKMTILEQNNATPELVVYIIILHVNINSTSTINSTSDMCFSHSEKAIIRCVKLFIFAED